MPACQIGIKRKKGREWREIIFFHSGSWGAAPITGLWTVCFEWTGNAKPWCGRLQPICHRISFPSFCPASPPRPFTGKVIETPAQISSQWKKVVQSSFYSGSNFTKQLVARLWNCLLLWNMKTIAGGREKLKLPNGFLLIKGGCHIFLSASVCRLEI